MHLLLVKLKQVGILSDGSANFLISIGRGAVQGLGAIDSSVSELELY